MMRPSYEDLEEQVAYLTAELGQSASADAVDKVRLAFAGILAHRDGDGGQGVAIIYRRIADRLTGQPRRAA